MKQISFFLLTGLVLLSSCRSPWRSKQYESLSRANSLNVLSVDSSTVIDTKLVLARNPAIIIYFMPDCEFCQDEIGYLLQDAKALKDYKLFLVTNAATAELKGFCKQYRTELFKNVFVGTDYRFEMYRYFAISSYPTIIIYDKNGTLKRIYQGEIEISRIKSAIAS